jgi:hypothetical protein
MYLTGYIIFGFLFLAGVIGYWVFARHFVGTSDSSEKKSASES